MRRLHEYEAELARLLTALLAPAEGPYVSYSRAPAHWELSDNSRPPAKKPFSKASWDRATRTFRGEIVWAPLSFGGAKRWRYEITFSVDLNTIVAGQNRSYSDAEGTQLLTTTRFGPEGQLCYWRRGAYGTGQAAATSP